MSDYTSAPATKLLATHCAACARPLVDAQSVESGVGPECRKKHGLPDTLTDAARAECNAAVYRLALQASDLAPAGYDAAADLNVLIAAGATKLADRCLKRMAAVRITEEGGRLVVEAPYSEAAAGAWRTVPGRRWDKDRKANTAPVSSRPALWALLQTYYGGRIGRGPRGAFLIPRPAAPAGGLYLWNDTVSP